MKTSITLTFKSSDETSLRLPHDSVHVTIRAAGLPHRPRSLSLDSLDSEDDFCSGCRNASHQQQLTTVLFRTTLARASTTYELICRGFNSRWGLGKFFFRVFPLKNASSLFWTYFVAPIWQAGCPKLKELFVANLLLHSTPISTEVVRKAIIFNKRRSLDCALSCCKACRKRQSTKQGRKHET